MRKLFEQKWILRQAQDDGQSRRHSERSEESTGIVRRMDPSTSLRMTEGTLRMAEGTLWMTEGTLWMAEGALWMTGEVGAEVTLWDMICYD